MLQAPLGDWLVAAHEGGSRLFMLPPVARWVWEARQVGLSAEETGGVLAARFGLLEDDAISDVKSLFAQWHREWTEDDRNSTAGPSTSRESSETWVAGPVCRRWRLRLAGATIDIGVSDGEIGRLLSPIIADLQVRHGKKAIHSLILDGTAATWFLYVDGVSHASGAGAEEAVVQTFSELVALGCKAQKRLVVLHAAGLAVRDDFGIVLIGESGAGKTTLVAAMNALNYALLGDDVVPVTPEGFLAGLGMSLCLKEGSWHILKGLFPALENAKVLNRYGQRVRFVTPRGPKMEYPVPLGLFLFPQFTAGSQARVERLPPEEVLRRIAEVNVVIPELTQESLDALLAWVASAPAFALVYPDLDTGVRLVRELVLEETDLEHA